MRYLGVEYQRMKERIDPARDCVRFRELILVNKANTDDVYSLLVLMLAAFHQSQASEGVSYMT